jgi:HPt (histidine-containing phosphotransfer) domain-containing protein
MTRRATMNKQIESLKKYGVNIDETMKRFVNDEEFYLECMDMFFQDDSLEKLIKAIKENNNSVAFDAAHTLKGIVGNLGLEVLFEKVSTLVEELRDNRPINASKYLDEINEEYTKILNCINQ